MIINPIDPLDAHDRLLHFKKDQEQNVFQGVEDCLKKNADCVSMQEYFPYVYIFAHPRTRDGVKVMIYQPRLTKPRAQTNSFLFRVQSKSDLVEIVWMLPAKPLWPQYTRGKITCCEEVLTSIANFRDHRDQLEAPHPDDWPERKIKDRLVWLAQQWKKK